MCSEKTYNLHVEVVNTLLVLLSPMAYSPSHAARTGGDIRAHNPFLHLMMVSALPDGSRSHWASGLTRRLLQNIVDQLAATGPNAMANTAVVTMRKAREMSLVTMSGTSEQIYEPDESSFVSRYFTLEGVGSIAGECASSVLFFFAITILRFDCVAPVVQHQYFASRGASFGDSLLARKLPAHSPIAALFYCWCCFRVVETKTRWLRATLFEKRSVKL